jgi:outer membrane protein with beta-barrel domain
MRKPLLTAASLVLALPLCVGPAAAQATFGRTTFGGNAALIINTTSASADMSTTAVVTFQFSRFSPNRRVEFGGAMTIYGNGSTSGTSSTTVSPNFRVNFNTKPLGRKQNLLLYGGVKFGLSASAFSVGGTSSSTASALWGFQFGENMFVSDKAALNVEGNYDFSATPDGFGGSVSTFTGTIAVGARFFF